MNAKQKLNALLHELNTDQLESYVNRLKNTYQTREGEGMPEGRSEKDYLNNQTLKQEFKENLHDENLIDQQFRELIKSKQELLTPDYTDVSPEIEKLQDLSLEYERMQDTDYSRDYQEIAADWSMSEGDKDAAYEKIENLVKYQEERALEIEKEMSVILTKELLNQGDYNKSFYELDEHNGLKNNQLSEIKICGGNGHNFYLGRDIYSTDQVGWIPYNQVSESMGTRAEAEKALEKAVEFNKMISGIGDYNLKIIAKSLAQPDLIEQDPMNRLKSNLIQDSLEHDRGLVLQKQSPAPVTQELSR